MSEADKTTQEKPVAEGTENEVDSPKNDNEHQRKVNVGNLPSDVTEQQLREYFSGHEIERVEIYHYRNYTLALLLFKDKDAATKAITEKDGSIFRERRLRLHLEYITIRHIKRDVIVTVLDDESVTEDQLWDKVKEAGVELVSVLCFYPLGYITLAKDADKTAILEKLNAAGFNAHDVNQRDQNQHLDIWRAAKLFFRNRNRVQLLNIPTQWIEDKEEMKKQCAEGGVITEAVSNNVNQSASNYARVFYESEEQAIKAAAALNGRVFEGKRIHALHLGSALIPNYKTSVYVASLEKTVTEEHVYDHFQQFGEIEFVNRRNCNDAAIICFKDAASLEKALSCVTFPAPTEEDPNATKEVTVKAYNGPLVLRPLAVKRKLKTSEDGQPMDAEEKTKEQEDVLKKLQAYHPVFVGNVPLNCPPLELKRYFAQHGPIKFMFSPQILSYRTSAPHPVKTFIIYYNIRASAVNACKFLDHKFFGGHRLHVLPLRGEMFFDVKKTIKITKIPYLSEDALFKKIKPFVGKINRIVKKSRSAAYIELNDLADVDKFMDVDAADHPLSKGKMEMVGSSVGVRLYDETDSRVLTGIAKIIAKNPDMLKKTPIGPLNKRPRMNGPGFNQGPPGFNANNNMNNPQAIQDLLRLAFMSGKNVGESLASNQNSFNAADPPQANSNNFGDGGFGNRNNNRNNQGGQNFRGQGRNPNQNQNNRGNANNFGNFQNAPGNNQNRGGQNMNRGNQQMNNRAGNNDDSNVSQNNRTNLNNQGNNRVQQNKPATGGNNLTQNNRNQGGGINNLNRNQNRNQNNRNNFDNGSFGGGSQSFGNNRNNNFSSDNFSSDSFGNNRNNDNFSSDNFSGSSNNRSNFGGNNRNQNDSFGSSFSGGNNRFSNDNNQFGGNFNNRNQGNRFNNDDSSFGGNNQNKGNNFGNNRQNKFGNNSGNNQGGGMSFGEFNSNANRSNFGGNNSGNNSGGGFNAGNNAGGNKWNNSNSGQSNTGRIAGTIFSRRF